MTTLDKIHYSIAAFILLIVFGLMYFVSINNFLLTHTFFELFAAVVSMTIFSIGWNTRDYSRNNFMTLLAIGYLVVGILTIFHALSYRGIGVFQDCGADVSTQFWILARYVESISMLLATIYRNKNKCINAKFTLVIFLFINISLVYIIFTGNFPKCFVEDTGLTSFKIISEYIICGILLYTGYLLGKQRDKMESDILLLIQLSIASTIISELLLTLYADPFSLMNILGHFFMVISVIFIYISLVKGSFTNPYRSLFKYIIDYAKELEQKNQELEIKDKAIASSQNAIIFTDLNGIITYGNETFLELLGYEKEEILGRTVYDFLITSNTLINNREKLLSHKLWYGEIKLKKKDNSIHYGLLTANLIISKQGEPIGCSGSILDITKQKSIEEELIKAKDEAYAANVAKSYFLANMSHEIRTPMNGIIGFLQLLEMTSPSKKQLEYIKNIKASTDSLLKLINDILDISKIEAGKMELEDITFDLHAVIEKAVTSFIPIAEDKGLKFSKTISPNVPCIVRGDPTRLRQVICNVISNAIKFTDAGQVKLDVGICERNENNSILQFKVEDTGIGIKREVLNKLFQPFTQADASSSRRYGGTGLGITICKSIVEMMNGTVQVKSIEGKGTTFIFTVTLKEASPDIIKINYKNNINQNSVVQDVKQYNLKVLLVEDNEINICLLEEMLKIHGIECDLELDGEGAVNACLRKKYDLVFMDCQMPVMDGYEATRRIREAEVNKKHTIIIAMTANAMKGDAQKCLDAGMDDYLSKPIDNKKLLDIINQYYKFS